jgi:arsenate reductase
MAGHPATAHWGIEDPAAVEGPEFEKERAFVQAAKYLKTRISMFLNLPIASLDKISLAARLREIGMPRDQPVPPLAMLPDRTTLRQWAGHG